jgi:hypothetical protein
VRKIEINAFVKRVEQGLIYAREDDDIYVRERPCYIPSKTKQGSGNDGFDQNRLLVATENIPAEGLQKSRASIFAWPYHIRNCGCLAAVGCGPDDR